jgi:hypothetical protein
LQHPDFDSKDPTMVSAIHLSIFTDRTRAPRSAPSAVVLPFSRARSSLAGVRATSGRVDDYEGWWRSRFQGFGTQVAQFGQFANGLFERRSDATTVESEKKPPTHRGPDKVVKRNSAGC